MEQPRALHRRGQPSALLRHLRRRLRRTRQRPFFHQRSCRALRRRAARQQRRIRSGKRLIISAAGIEFTGPRCSPASEISAPSAISRIAAERRYREGGHQRAEKIHRAGHRADLRARHRILQRHHADRKYRAEPQGEYRKQDQQPPQRQRRQRQHQSRKPRRTTFRRWRRACSAWRAPWSGRLSPHHRSRSRPAESVRARLRWR